MYFVKLVRDCASNLIKPKVAAKQLSAQEMDNLINNWQPEPLVPDNRQDHPALNPVVVQGKVGKYVTVNGTDCLNLATHNYLGLVGNEKMESSAIECMETYAVGACGPRGFYGTTQVHLDLESRIARFMGLQEAIMYSYGFSTVASAIAAYAKQGDVIFADQGVNFAVRKGLQASRSQVRFFKHNDMDDLQRLLVESGGEKVRKFLVVEGVYMNSGDICPLDQIVALKTKYKIRLLVDESISFGALGRQGRGVTEYFGLPATDVDVIMGSLEYAVASAGGFCAGTTHVVGSQRISGLGYCFSASLPPLVAAAAIAAIDQMDQDPDMFAQLNQVCRRLHEALSQLRFLSLRGGHQDSPIKHLTLINSSGSSEQDDQILRLIASESLKRGVALIAASYLDEDGPGPSLRLVANRLLRDSELHHVVDILDEASHAVLGQ